MKRQPQLHPVPVHSSVDRGARFSTLRSGLAEYGGQTCATHVGDLFRGQSPTGFLGYTSGGPREVKGRRGELSGRHAKRSPGVDVERP